ncbi:hypothetical protein K474DRAFT_1702366, partial [Panus rudis PR-1116 ss-1]
MKGKKKTDMRRDVPTSTNYPLRFSPSPLRHFEEDTSPMPDDCCIGIVATTFQKDRLRATEQKRVLSQRSLLNPPWSPMAHIVVDRPWAEFIQVKESLVSHDIHCRTKSTSRPHQFLDHRAIHALTVRLDRVVTTSPGPKHFASRFELYNMGFECEGCNAEYASQGQLIKHIEQTRNPACRAAYLDRDAL